MKPIFALTLCLFLFKTGYCQHKLYYFFNPADSLVGVKDENGKIIIPPKYYGIRATYMDHVKTPISDDIIIMERGEIRKGQSKSTASYSFGDAYDRKGHFLFHPLGYDSGLMNIMKALPGV